jgi:hypothetical protein
MNNLSEIRGGVSNSWLSVPIRGSNVNLNNCPGQGTDVAAALFRWNQAPERDGFDPLPSMFMTDFGRPGGARIGPGEFAQANNKPRPDRGSSFETRKASRSSGFIAALQAYVTAGVVLTLIASAAAFYFAANPFAYAKTQGPASAAQEGSADFLMASLAWPASSPRPAPVLRDRDPTLAASPAIETWSDTVEAFKQLVAENRQSQLSAKKPEENEQAYRRFETWLTTSRAVNLRYADAE